jgi:hypothetical protein
MDRNAFIDRECGLACSVHRLAFHIEPYHRDTHKQLPQHFLTASALWPSFRV